MAVKVLLDTDIGSDIDDAVCLAYLLAQPDCDLLGITTVTGEAERRARLASALCTVAGKEVPIFPGVEEPLLVRQNQPVAPQAEALANWPHATDFPRGEAVDFLRRTIRAQSGEVTLLTIGPLTNIALLFALDPEVPRLLKALVMMGGHYMARGPSREWNIACDPHAAAMVFKSPAPIRAVGLDVTRQVTMAADEVRARFQTALLRPVLDFAEVWFREQRRLTFHDPLAAATIFDDSICVFGRGTVQMDPGEGRQQGITHWRAGTTSTRHEVAFAVNVERFFAHFFAAFA